MAGSKEQWCEKLKRYQGDPMKSIDSYLKDKGLRWEDLTREHLCSLFNTLAQCNSPHIFQSHCSGKNPREEEGMLREGKTWRKRRHHWVKPCR